MTIAGSDSGGGAGIQADLRTFAFHCVHGTCALTCVTAQNTLGVASVTPVAPEMVALQIDTVLSDIPVRAVKTGMLLQQDIMLAVVDALERWHISTLVADPVMVSRAGAILIDEMAIATLKNELIPRASIATPNRYEAQLLSGLELLTLEDMQRAAASIYQLGARSVLVKGGGMTGELQGVDVWFDGTEYRTLSTKTVNTIHTHGTGCTLSAAIAANLALGLDSLAAVIAAKDYVTRALGHGLSIGQGTGPVGHFYPLLSYSSESN